MNQRKLALLSVFTLCLAVSAAGDDRLLVAAWNFNDDSDAPGSQLIASAGIGELTTNWVVANLADFAGSTVNLLEGDVSGRDLAFQNGGTTGSPANEGNFLTFQVSTTGLSDLHMTYAGRTTNTGMRDLEWSYSTDGSAFTPFQTVDHVEDFGGGTYGLVTIDFSSIAAAANAPMFYVRGTFFTQLGQPDPTASGSTRFDNFQFTAIPEPSAYAVLFGGLALILVVRMRRRAR